MTSRPMLILIAGPYKSGTGGNPDAMAANLRKLEAAAWPIFEAGHIPMIGEWVALPVLHSAGATALDDLADDVLYPTAQRLLQHCDGVLRLPGQSAGQTRTSRPPSASVSPSITMSPRSPAVRLSRRRMSRTGGRLRPRGEHDHNGSYRIRERDDG